MIPVKYSKFEFGNFGLNNIFEEMLPKLTKEQIFYSPWKPLYTIYNLNDYESILIFTCLIENHFYGLFLPEFKNNQFAFTHPNKFIQNVLKNDTFDFNLSEQEFNFLKLKLL